MTLLTESIADQLIAEQRTEEAVDIVIPYGYTEIYWKAFAWNELTSVIIPSTVTTIGEYAFTECYMTSVVIPAVSPRLVLAHSNTMN